MGKDAPDYPDPGKTAEQQYTWNTKAAGDIMKMNAINQTGPFGTANFQKNAQGMPTGITTSLSPGLQASAGNITGNLGSTSGLLPSVAFDSTTAAPDTSYISNELFNRGAGLLADPFAQARNEMDINLTNRGLPIGSEARMLSEGNLGRQQSLAYSDLAHQAALAAPAEQQRLIGNARTDYLQPYDQARGGLGLLAGLKGLTPGANQPQASIAAPNYSDLVNRQYNAAMQEYQNNQAGLGSLIKTGLSIGLAPFTGGASLMGMGIPMGGSGGTGLYGSGGGMGGYVG